MMANFLAKTFQVPLQTNALEASAPVSQSARSGWAETFVAFVGMLVMIMLLSRGGPRGRYGVTAISIFIKWF